MSEKPVIFISHSSKDKDVALHLQLQLMNVFDISALNVFRSTDPFAIPSSSEWFEEIKKNLDKADALVVIVSQASINSVWVGYEIGYFWHKTSGQNIYPLVMPETEIRGPIERLQYKLLNNSDSLKAFFTDLCRNLKTGNSETADVSLIVKSAIDANTEGIRQVIRDYLVYEAQIGETINYRKLDRELSIPPGSSERYFPEIAENWSVDTEKRQSGGTALYPPSIPAPGDSL
jgi:hypothetical protein